MTCIPESGGCERPFTDAFVEHLNRTDGLHYVHRACLDVPSGQISQPEALYVDGVRNTRLVIERKSISWPDDYPYGHKKSHFAADQLSAELTGLPTKHLYEIRLPMQMEGKDSELKAFALRATAEIKKAWPEIATGSILTGRIDNRWPFSFRQVPEWEKEENAPVSGLKFIFVGSSSVFDFIDPTDLPEQIASALRKIYFGCVKKFGAYSEAKRVLVLEPHADLKRRSVVWWREVFSVLPPPDEVGEIWSAKFDWVDDSSEAWVFERLR
jgi:hypothetical protein